MLFFLLISKYYLGGKRRLLKLVEWIFTTDFCFDTHTKKQAHTFLVFFHTQSLEKRLWFFLSSFFQKRFDWCCFSSSFWPLGFPFKCRRRLQLLLLHHHSLLIFTVFLVISNYSLDFLHFGGDDDWIALPDFLGTEFLVVEVALVLITVTVYWAKQASATAREAWKRIILS